MHAMQVHAAGARGSNLPLPAQPSNGHLTRVLSMPALLPPGFYPHEITRMSPTSSCSFIPYISHILPHLSDFNQQSYASRSLSCWPCLVAYQDAYYDSEEYREAGGNGTQFWIYQRVSMKGTSHQGKVIWDFFLISTHIWRNWQNVCAISMIQAVQAFQEIASIPPYAVRLRPWVNVVVLFVPSSRAGWGRGGGSSWGALARWTAKGNWREDEWGEGERGRIAKGVKLRLYRSIIPS